jgi:hypothetical protein
MSQVSTSFADSTYSASNKPSTTTLKADIQAIETALNDTDSTAVKLTGSQTIADKILTSPVINTQITGTAIVDEDAMTSDSAVKVPTQQSVKAFVTSGTVTMTNKTLTSPTITGATISTSTLTKPTINASTGGTQSYTPAGGATATLLCALANRHLITMPAGNITIALDTVTTGQIFTVDITQDGGGSRTVTWFSTIRWAGGSAPTLTTTGSKRDSFIFVCTGSNTYDGSVIGFNY